MGQTNQLSPDAKGQKKKKKKKEIENGQTTL